MSRAQEEKHEYQDEFFEYINAGSGASANVVCPILVEWMKPASLLDVGCGAGAWCRVWQQQGVANVVGVDGEYVNASSLLFAAENFRRQDLAQAFDLKQTFDLVTSLEVAEHVPKQSATTFVENLARHGDRILFSAAVPGQGGEFHVNEQPLSFWRAQFQALGFRCFDPLRPRISHDTQVEPWYRYNSLLYVKDSAVSQLPQSVQDSEVSPSMPIPDLAPLSWKARNAILRGMPKPALDALVRVKHAWTRRIRATRR